MKCVIAILLGLTLTGCWWDTKYITVCPVPTPVPAPIYQTAQMPETISSADVIKLMLTDLMLCQDTETQLRVVLRGYEK